jgi:predicted lipoprotein with Yx(FWY)xxD motif
MRKALIPASIVTAVAFVFSGATAAAKPTTGSSTESSSVVVMTRTLPKLGTILVNSKGRTLYMFVPDKQKKVTCVGACAAVWPPLKIAKGAKAVAKGAVKKSLLRSDKDAAGGYVVTYNGWPLYTYVSDTSAGEANGQALNLNGGLWYVLSPSGKVIKTKAS